MVQCKKKKKHNSITCSTQEFILPFKTGENSLSEVQNKSKASNRVWEAEVGKERKSGKTEEERQTGAALGPVATGCVCVCVLVCVSWEGTVGEFGGMEEGIRALGPAPQGTEKMGREWREAMGDGKQGERKGCGQF